MELEKHEEERQDEMFKRQIEEWKNTYWGSVYLSEINEEVYIWRGLSRSEFKKANEYFEDDYDRAEFVCRTCVLHPEIDDYSVDMFAGVPETLTEQILAQSGFTMTEQQFDGKLREYESEMQTFDNQISCIVKEAFPDLSLEEIENWQFEKTLWYYARAKWVLEFLRGVVLQKEE